MFADQHMRTTLDIDEDILLAAKDYARQRGTSIGRAISEIARKGLEPKARIRERNGVPLFSTKKEMPVITLDLVNRLRDEGP
jgi:hypothetical protein